MAAVHATLAAATAGRGGVLVLEGDAGVGKTRMVGEAAAAAQRTSLQVLSARGSEMAAREPFGLIRRAVDRLVRGRPTTASGSAPALFSEPNGGPVAAEPAAATAHGLYWFLADAVSARPGALLLDDVHWADRQSLQFLVLLAEGLDEVPLAVVLALRPPDPPVDAHIAQIARQPTATRQPLDPLTRDGVARVIASVTGVAPADAFTDACSEVTGGNPFHLVALLDDLRGRDLAPDDSTARQVPEMAPRAVADHLLVRLRQLRSEARPLVSAAAVLGDGCAVGDAADIAGLDADKAAAAADELVRAGILRDGLRLEFVHPIVRQAAYAALGPHDRAQLHRRAAQHLSERRGGEPQAATHLLHTGPVGERWAIDCLEAAARVALSRGAPEEAVTYLERACSESLDGSSEPRVLHQLGVARLKTGSADGASVLSKAVEVATEPRTRALAARDLATALMLAGRPAAAVALLERVIPEVQPTDRSLAVLLRAEVVSIGRTDVATRPVTFRHLPHLEEAAVEDSPAGRVAAANLAMEAIMQERSAELAVELSSRAWAGGRLLAEHTADSQVLYIAIGGALYADRIEASIGRLDDAVHDARTRGSSLGYGLATCWRSHAHLRAGHVLDAESDAREALRVLGPAAAQMRPYAVAFLVDALLERGRLEEADAALRAEGLEGSLPDHLTFHLLLNARGRLRGAQGRHEDAVADLRACADGQRAWGSPPAALPWRSTLAWNLRRDDREAAAQLADEELVHARRLGAPRAHGIAARAAALLSRGGVDLRLLEEAVEVLTASEARLEHGRAVIELGAALRRDRRGPAARQALREGLEIARGCRAAALEARATDELLAAGGRAPERPSTGLEALTGSERRVAELAAGGLTNRDIAQALFVSTKTVEKHLASVYRKLGIASRRELPPALGRRTDGF